MRDYVPTNAASSGVRLDKKTFKAIAQRSNLQGLQYLSLWSLVLILTGAMVLLLRDTFWLVPALVLHGTFLTVPAYSMSHETAHGTAFRTRWLNELVFWLTSVVYMEEPLHRRYTHTNHHTHTWHVGKDSQMPFDTPMRFGGWLIEVSGIGLLIFHMSVFVRLCTGRYSETMLMVTPAQELPKMTRNAWLILLVYIVVAGSPFFGVWWPMLLIVLPRLLGSPVMLLFTLIQHVELQENSPSIVESTRSFKGNWLSSFLYMNMNNHVEHHLYPQVPFHALPKLASKLEDQLPDRDPGFWRTNWEVLAVVTKRSLGLKTKAPSIRQAPHMVTHGGPIEKIAKKTM